jgi:hypothetical protein
MRVSEFFLLSLFLLTPGESLAAPEDLLPDDRLMTATMSLELDDAQEWSVEPRNPTSRERPSANDPPMPLRPDEPLGVWRFDLEVPLLRQLGTKTNCGPTSAAMALGAFGRNALATNEADGLGDLYGLRDVIGEWTWQKFPLRQMRLSGYDAGMTTRDMMEDALDHFGEGLDWTPVDHAWLPLEAWSVIALKQSLSERRPMIVLAEARLLWGLEAPGLHWVVVRGTDRGHVVFNDPGDGTIGRIPLERFWRAWRLPDVYRSLPMVSGFEALTPSLSMPVTHKPHVPFPRLRADALEPW